MTLALALPSLHPAIQLLLLWVLVFVSLGLALVALNVFYAVIGNDLSLRSLGQEAVIAAIAAVIQAASIWLVLSYVPAAGRALIFPGMMVVFLYKLAHLEDWSFHDAAFLMMFQIVLIGVGVCLILGHVGAGLLLLAIVAIILSLLGSFLKDL